MNQLGRKWLILLACATSVGLCFYFLFPWKPQSRPEFRVSTAAPLKVESTPAIPPPAPIPEAPPIAAPAPPQASASPVYSTTESAQPSTDTTNAVVVAPTTTPIQPQASSLYESQKIYFPKGPQVIELKVPGGGNGKETIRAVALTSNGMVLSLARFFNNPSHVTVNGDPSPVLCPGWLARDDSSGWIILKVRLEDQDTQPALLAAAYAPAPEKTLLVFLPDKEDRSPNALTAVPSVGPADAASHVLADRFWISVSPENVLPGSPVTDERHCVVGVIDQVRPELHLALVARVMAPFAPLEKALQQVDPILWKTAPPEHATIPFTDPKISSATVDSILNKLSGAALVSACDQLLLQNDKSSLAWYLASHGYARAEKFEQAEASAKMLTEVAPRRWESWLTYAQELESQKKIGLALDAYYMAVNVASPSFFRSRLRGETGGSRGGGQDHSASGGSGHGHGHGHGGGDAGSDNSSGNGAGGAATFAEYMEDRSNNPSSDNEKFSAEALRETVMTLVRCLEKTGDIDVAIHVLEALTQQESGFYDAWLALARNRQQQGLAAPALAAYQHAVQLNPQSIPAWSAIALLSAQIPEDAATAAEARQRLEWLGENTAH